MAAHRKYASDEERRAAKAAQNRAKAQRHYERLRSTTEGVARIRAKNRRAHAKADADPTRHARKLAQTRASYQRQMSTPEGRQHRRAALEGKHPKKRLESYLGSTTAPQVRRAAPDPAAAAARAILRDAVDLYRELKRNYEHLAAQSGVMPARLRSARAGVQAAYRGVLEAQAALLRVQGKSDQ